MVSGVRCVVSIEEKPKRPKDQQCESANQQISDELVLSEAYSLVMSSEFRVKNET